MPRIQPLTLENAQAESKTVLENVQQKLGQVPNIFATLAHSPAAAGAFFGIKEALAGGTISAKLGEQIALAVGNANSCEYCVAAHTAIGKMSGLTEQQTQAAQRGQAGDAKDQAALAFAQVIIEREGFVRDEDLQAFLDAGWSQAQAIEVLTHVVLNIFTNYFNHIAETQVDFPSVELAAAQAI